MCDVFLDDRSGAVREEAHKEQRRSRKKQEEKERRIRNTVDCGFDCCYSNEQCANIPFTRWYNSIACTWQIDIRGPDTILFCPFLLCCIRPTTTDSKWVWLRRCFKIYILGRRVYNYYSLAMCIWFIDRKTLALSLSGTIDLYTDIVMLLVVVRAVLLV